MSTDIREETMLRIASDRLKDADVFGFAMVSIPVDLLQWLSEMANARHRELDPSPISDVLLKADGITNCGSSARTTGYCIEKGVWLWLTEGNWKFDADCFGVTIPVSTMGHVRTLRRLATTPQVEGEHA